MFNEEQWNRWVIQTATNWQEITSVINKTGVETIDHDHQRIISAILELDHVIKQMEQNSISLELIDNAKTILEKIYLLTSTHFEREELIIRKYQLSGFSTQQAEHKKILNLLKDVLNDFSDGKVTVSYYLKHTIIDWIRDHINRVDFDVFKIDRFRDFVNKTEDTQNVSALVRATGVNEIDSAHDVIVTSGVDLVRLIGKTMQMVIVPLEHRMKIVSMLEKYKKVVEDHFSYEEKLIKRFGISNLSEQKTQHHLFLSELSRVIMDVEKGQLLGMYLFAKKVVFWWLNHINFLDNDTFFLHQWLKKTLSDYRNVSELRWLVFKTNNPLIDQEHFHFIDLLISQYGKSVQSEDVTLFYQQLFDYAERHFAHEESLLDCSEERLVVHRAEHQAILTYLREEAKRSVQGVVSLTSDRLAEVLSYWITHINIVDKEDFYVRR